MPSRPDNWPKISAFVPLLYAKSLGISEAEPTLNWSLEHGLLPKQILLAKCVELLFEACALHVLENRLNLPQENPSRRLYELALSGLAGLQEPALYRQLSECVGEYHDAIDRWRQLEKKFLQPGAGGPSDRLTFENYAWFEQHLDFGQAARMPVLLAQWEHLVRRKYAALVAHACRGMATLAGHRQPDELERAAQFGRSFAFAFVANGELGRFLEGADEEQTRLHLPLLIYLLLQARQADCRQLLEQLRDGQMCSLQTHLVSFYCRL